MNLFFRMIRVFLAAWLARSEVRHGGETFRLPFRVWPNDLDTNLHMNNGRYLTLMDLGRVDMMIRIGMLKEMRRRRWYPVVAASHIVFRRSLEPFEAFDMETRVEGFDDDWAYMRQDMVKRDGQLAARAIFRTAFLHKGKRIAAADLAEALGIDLSAHRVSPEIAAAFPKLA